MEGDTGVQDPSLVGWWKMRDLTVKDSSGNGAHGNILGSTTWDEGNGALTFQEAKVSFGTKASLSGYTSFTISAWVRAPPTATSGGVIIQQRDLASSLVTDSSDGEYQLYLDGGMPGFCVFGDGTCQFHLKASVAVNDNNWHHVVAVRSDAEGHIYVNGVLCVSGSGPVSYLSRYISVYMGCDARAENSYFVGSLMGIRLYNRALGMEEICYLSTRPEALIGWWKMDERVGLTVKDASGPNSSGVAATGSITGITKWENNCDLTNLDRVNHVGLRFERAGHVSFGTKASLSGKTSFSIHAWVKIPESATSAAAIIHQGSPCYGYKGEYMLSVHKARLEFVVRGDEEQFNLYGSTIMNDNKWHHVVAARDGEDGYLYIDGKISACGSGTVGNLNGELQVFTGWFGRPGHAGMDGSWFTLKDVKVYNQLVLTLP